MQGIEQHEAIKKVRIENSQRFGAFFVYWFIYTYLIYLFCDWQWWELVGSLLGHIELIWLGMLVKFAARIIYEPVVQLVYWKEDGIRISIMDYLWLFVWLVYVVFETSWWELVGSLLDHVELI